MSEQTVPVKKNKNRMYQGRRTLVYIVLTLITILCLIWF